MKKLMLVLLALGLSACTADSPRLMAPPPVYSEGKATIENFQEVEFNPKLDILFVLDNSKSMENELGILRANIEDFAESFSTKSVIDYHIGVVTVYDSTRFGSVVVKPNFRTKGELLPLIDREGNEVQSRTRFVDRDNIYALNDLFNIKTPFIKEPKISTDSEGNEIETPAQGPEIEEHFSPVKAVFANKKLKRTTNWKFHRKNSHLVVIFVTDAEDSSPKLDQKDLFNFLFKLKGKDINKLSVYGVLCAEGDRSCRNVRKSDGKTIEQDSLRIRELVNLINQKKHEKNAVTDFNGHDGSILKLKSSTWGDELADVGYEIKRKTLESQKIILSTKPEYDIINERPMIEVSYAGNNLPYDSKNGWSYKINSKKQHIVTVHGGIEVSDGGPQEKVQIKFMRVNKGPQSKPVQ